MTNPYEDIINLPHHQSNKHPHMPAENRAAQFAPFAALTGYGDAVNETARQTDAKIELDEYEKATLNEKLNMLRDSQEEQPETTITYFVPDKMKSGGAYVTITGTVKKIDECGHTVLMRDGTKILIDDIFEIETGRCGKK